MIEVNDIIRIRNQLISHNDIKNNYRIAQIKNNIIQIKPFFKVFNDDGWEIKDFGVRYNKNKLELIYHLYKDKSYIQKTDQIKAFAVVNIFKSFYSDLI